MHDVFQTLFKDVFASSISVTRARVDRRHVLGRVIANRLQRPQIRIDSLQILVAGVSERWPWHRRVDRTRDPLCLPLRMGWVDISVVPVPEPAVWTRGQVR